MKDYEGKIYVADFFFTRVVLFVQKWTNLSDIQKAFANNPSKIAVLYCFSRDW
jgi:protein SCO1/2